MTNRICKKQQICDTRRVLQVLVPGLTPVGIELTCHTLVNIANDTKLIKNDTIREDKKRGHYYTMRRINSVDGLISFHKNEYDKKRIKKTLHFDFNESYISN
jgi:hypothetical protein